MRQALLAHTSREIDRPVMDSCFVRDGDCLSRRRKIDYENRSARVLHEHRCHRFAAVPLAVAIHAAGHRKRGIWPDAEGRRCSKTRAAP